jgi:TRAP-type C4-dicarboxylate transport system permease small subunit
MSELKKVIKWIDINAQPIFIMIMFIAMTCLIIIQVILRFFFGSGFAWGEEVAVYLFVWTTLVSISYAFRNNRQINVEFLKDLLPQKIRRVLMIIIDISMIIVLTFFLRGSITNVITIAKYGDTAVALPVTLNVLYAAAVVGWTLSIARILQTLVWKIKRFNASYELFVNFGGVYSGTNDICFTPKRFRDELESNLNPDVVREEKEKLYLKNNRGGGNK